MTKLKQLLCFLTGHGGIERLQQIKAGEWVGVCKRCGAKVNL